MFSNLNFFLCSLSIPDPSLFKLDLNVEISAFHSLMCKGVIWEICWGLLFMIIFFGENISCFELLVTWVLVQWVHTWFVRKYGVSSFVYFYFHVCFQLNYCISNWFVLFAPFYLTAFAEEMDTLATSTVLTWFYPSQQLYTHDNASPNDSNPFLVLHDIYIWYL